MFTAAATRNYKCKRDCILIRSLVWNINLTLTTTHKTWSSISNPVHWFHCDMFGFGVFVVVTYAPLGCKPEQWVWVTHQNTLTMQGKHRCSGTGPHTTLLLSPPPQQSRSTDIQISRLVADALCGNPRIRLEYLGMHKGHTTVSCSFLPESWAERKKEVHRDYSWQWCWWDSSFSSLVTGFPLIHPCGL